MGTDLRYEAAADGATLVDLTIMGQSVDGAIWLQVVQAAARLNACELQALDLARQFPGVAQALGESETARSTRLELGRLLRDLGLMAPDHEIDWRDPLWLLRCEQDSHLAGIGILDLYRPPD